MWKDCEQSCGRLQQSFLWEVTGIDQPPVESVDESLERSGSAEATVQVTERRVQIPVQE